MKNRNPISLDNIKNSACAKLNAHLFEDLSKPNKQKRSKFNNQKTDVDGITFDSKKEAKRYKELRLLLKTGQIGFLARQVQFQLNAGGTHSLIYIADFSYIETNTGKQIVEDVKSPATRQLQVGDHLLEKKKMKIADTSQLIPFKIDNRTTIYIKPDADREKILQLYKKQAV